MMAIITLITILFADLTIRVRGKLRERIDGSQKRCKK